MLIHNTTIFAQEKSKTNRNNENTTDTNCHRC